MNRKEFKSIIDGSVNPDFYFEQRLKAKVLSTKPKKNKKWLAAPALLALCFAFAVVLNPFFDSGKIVQNYDLGLMIVYADEKDSVSLSSNGDMRASYPMDIQIGCVSTEGMTKEEIENRRKELENGDNGDKKGSFIFRSFNCEDEVLSVTAILPKKTEVYKDIIYYSANIGSLIIHYLPKEDVKRIEVNTESGYSVMTLCADDEAENAVSGKNISIGARKYKKLTKDSYQSAYYNPGFRVGWSASKKLLDEMNENPDLDLSQISDTVTITVKFKNGAEATNKVRLAFDKDGKMFAESIK